MIRSVVVQPTQQIPNHLAASRSFLHTFSLFALQPGSDNTVVRSCSAVRESRIMSRGNQRDRDRERAQARAGNKPKQGKSDGLTPEQRRERDAKALQEKLAKKAARESAGANGGKNGMKTNK